MEDQNPPQAPPQPPQELSLRSLLQEMIQKGASDLHLTVGNRPKLRVDGDLVNAQSPAVLNPRDTLQLSYSILTEAQKKRFETEDELDFSFGVQNLSRFRGNVYKQRGCVAMAIRQIPYEIISVEKLGLPPILNQLSERPRGLILVTGPTGSGKSTTLAAMVDKINRERKSHIITIEDPIEFLHRNKKSTINQREIGTDTVSFKSALRAALRQAPKVILVGEMRDRETIEIALEAGETGHLVISTLHTIDAPKTIDRIIGVFPKNEEAALRARLASAVKWVISQRLIPTKSGGRIAAIEILRTSERTRDYIIHGSRDGKSLHDVMRDGYTTLGTQTFDMVLKDYVEKGILSIETALLYATNANDLKVQLGDKINEAKPGVKGGEAGGGDMDLELDVKDLI